MSDGHFECRLHRRLENGNGIYLTLLVNPADATGDLSQLRVGSTLMIAWAETVNAEVEKIELPNPNRAAKGEDAQASPREKPKRAFKDLPLSQQAALRCENEMFRRFLLQRTGSTALGFDAPQYVRHWCGVASRSDLDVDPPAADLWRRLDTEYQTWLADEQYAESIHR